MPKAPGPGLPGRDDHAPLAASIGEQRPEGCITAGGF